MWRIYQFVLTAMLLLGGYVGVLQADEPKPVRIGVYVRSGFEKCLEDWQPTASYLTQKIPGYQFLVVPLASREDIFDSLESGNIDFLAANSAIYVCTETRFETSGLCGMLNRVDPSRHDNTGSLIRRSDRNDLMRIEDLQGTRLSAVKPWSFSGWIMQWQTLQQHHLHPLQNLALVEFEGTHQDVIQSVLDGTTDVGAVGTDILRVQVESGAVDPNTLYVFDRKGNAVRLDTIDKYASTDSYPDWVFAKAAATPDLLAEKIHKVLITLSHDLSKTESAYHGWSIPQNYQVVRNCLHDLMGPDYAYSTAMISTPSISLHILLERIALVIFSILSMVLLVFWRRAKRRGNVTIEGLQQIRSELNEVRASKNLIETILTKVGCGMDIVNEDNEIVYVTPGLEERYGPWRGKKCHEYYGGATKPCRHCIERAASEHREETTPYVVSCHANLQEDRHPIGNVPKGAKTKLLQVPFYDENGRWLYARVHLPPEGFPIKEDIEKLVVNVK